MISTGIRIVLVLALSGAWERSQAETPATATASLRSACQYLWSQQAEDGGWHSKQYGLLRSGQALTPFVLNSLIQIPEHLYQRPQGGVDRALDFIRAHLDKQGALGHADPDVVEYPVYSTAYAIECLAKVGNQSDEELVVRMANFLSAAQLDESNGFTPDIPAYGGWGFDAPRQPGQSGHMDLAHTRRALQALGAARDWRKTANGLCDKSIANSHAELFLRVVQRHPNAIAPQPRAGDQSQSSAAPYDGGFYFSPVVLAANKGRAEADADGAKYFRSYATATCDGILALFAADFPRDDERVARATEWLRKHDDFNYPQGVPQSHSEPWGDAIRYYHFAVRAEVYDRLDWPGDWRQKLATAVATQQAADGSFNNTNSPLMKEDDPLLATSLAVVALAHCSQ